MSIADFLWGFTQLLQDGGQGQTLSGAAQESRAEASHRIDQPSEPCLKQVEQLVLICRAMWTLIQEETNLTDEDLLARITELDVKDGALDGRYAKPPVACPKCGSKMCRKFRRCLFCGQEMPPESAFDTV